MGAPDGERFRLRVAIPANTIATNRIPDSSRNGTTESGRPLAEVPGSGVYQFEITRTQDRGQQLIVSYPAENAKQ